MAKQKPKAIMPLKHEFVASLDQFVQVSLNLYQAADIVKEYLPTQAARETLQKRLDEWKAAWCNDED